VKKGPWVHHGHLTSIQKPSNKSRINYPIFQHYTPSNHDIIYHTTSFDQLNWQVTKETRNVLQCFTNYMLQFQPPAKHNAQYCSQMAATLPCIDRSNLVPETILWKLLHVICQCLQTYAGIISQFRQWQLSYT
jgi:hypothetical protein